MSLPILLSKSILGEKMLVGQIDHLPGNVHELACLPGGNHCAIAATKVTIVVKVSPLQ